LIILSILFNFAFGLLIEKWDDSPGRRRTAFILMLCLNIGLLLYFKYAAFFVENLNAFCGLSLPVPDIALPLGISFYTFQIMSYGIDLYRRKIRAAHSLLKLGTYIVMFPQLIAGPIVVYSEVEEDLRSRTISFSAVEEGIRIFILGLASKVLIANNVGQLWEELQVLGYDNISTPLAWLGALAFTLQIYFDFNGYSLMAIGLGRMLGFSFPKNFDFPYISASITEFWRRWHMTLSAWFREYLYIPLGGNRRGKGRSCFNLFVVWFLTGFWHGAAWNFILWGLYFFVLLLLERAFLRDFLRKHRIFSHVYTMFFVMISWVIFAITELPSLTQYLGRMFSACGGRDIIYYYLGNYGVVLALGCLLSTPALRRAYGRIRESFGGVLLHMALLLLSVAYLADLSFNPFLYFRF
ncbi:MAG: MBOAT family protein, partial [Lachnospiraceae bacterium]|nr:MBOAT family protein [Lachnospiraceae bacterium]